MTLPYGSNKQIIRSQNNIYLHTVANLIHKSIFLSLMFLCACNWIIYNLNILTVFSILLVFIMLKKVLLSVALLAVSTSLTSCSYYKNWMGKGTKTETEKELEASEHSMDPRPDVNPNDSEGTLLGLPQGKPHMHPNNIRAVRPMDECVDGRYKSPSDKVQTLGYLKPGYKLPEPKKPYTYHGEHKKPVHKKKATPKVVKKDTYNAEAPKQEMDNKPMMHEDPAPVAVPAPVATPMKAPEAPVAPAQGMTPHTTAPVVAPVPAPVPAPAPMKAPEAPAAPSMSAPVAPTASLPTAPVVSSSPTAPAAVQAPSNTVSMGRITNLDYQEAEVDISATNTAILDQIAVDLKTSPTKNVRIQSYGYAKDANPTEARRNSLQRAIKIRKYLIDKDVNASRISVNAVEDVSNKSNRVEISFEELKAQ